MAHRLESVEALQVGELRMGRATLNLYREMPEPGAAAEQRWTVFGRVGRAVSLPDESDALLVLEDGRVFRGRVILEHSRTTIDWRGRTTEYEYRGAGTLDGATDADFG